MVIDTPADRNAARRTEGKRFASFVITGGLAALANLGARWLLSHVTAYALAVTLAYLVGMTTAYLLARAYVFEPTGNGRAGEFARFAMVNAISFAVVLGVSVGLADWVLPAIDWSWHAEDIAHVAGVMSPILLSYYAHKHFSFGRSA